MNTKETENNTNGENKELKPYEDFSGALAIPFSVMVFPKYGNRKVSFRTFVCTDNQKFDESSGRPILNETQNFAISSSKPLGMSR